MVVRSGFFQSIGGDRVYRSEFFASYFSSFIGNGVFPNPSSNLQVTANTGLQISVQPGKGWINGYYLINDAPINLTLTQADGVLSRIDRVIFSLDFTTREMAITVKQGVPSGNPVAPSLVRNTGLYELALADVRVNAGSTSITAANITDTRLNAQLCGIVSGLINQVDTTTLFVQYQQEFEDFLESIQSALDGDVAGNLLNMINALDDRLTRTQQDLEYQTPSITSNVISIQKRGNSNRLYFRLTSNVSGNIRISLNSGTTSLPLQDVNGNQVTLLERGFVEVVQGSTFFTLRNRGVSQSEIQALITAANEVEANSNALRQRYIMGVNDLGLNLPNTATFNDILVNLPNILSNSIQVHDGSLVGTIGTNGTISVTNLPFRPRLIFHIYTRQGLSTVFIDVSFVRDFAITGSTSEIINYSSSTSLVRVNSISNNGFEAVNNIGANITSYSYRILG